MQEDNQSRPNEQRGNPSERVDGHDDRPVHHEQGDVLREANVVLVDARPEEHVEKILKENRDADRRDECRNGTAFGQFVEHEDLHDNAQDRGHDDREDEAPEDILEPHDVHEERHVRPECHHVTVREVGEFADAIDQGEARRPEDIDAANHEAVDDELKNAEALDQAKEACRRPDDDAYQNEVIIGASTGLLGLVQGLSVLQFVVNGLVVGSIYVLGATGLTLIYGVRKFANFAHGDMMTFGAYMAFLMNVIWFQDILWGFVFAIVMTAVLGIVMEILVFNKLSERGPVAALVASIGITIFLQNFLNVLFGTRINQYNIRLTQNVPLLVVNGAIVVSINPLRGIATLFVGAALIVFLHALLTRTLLGKLMRATADNPDLARASGIKVRNVVLWTWGLSGAMAGVAGVLLGIFIDVRPGLGFNILLFIFAAVIVGGLGSPYGAMLGGFIVGIAQELSAALLDWLGRPTVIGLENPNAYRPVVAFVIMLLVLLLRPGGLAAGRVAVLRTGRGIFRWPKALKAED